MDTLPGLWRVLKLIWRIVLREYVEVAWSFRVCKNIAKAWRPNTFVETVVTKKRPSS